MPVSTFLQVGYLIQCTIAFTLMYLIHTYLSKKAIGMQTLHDLMIKDVIRSYSLVQINILFAILVFGNLAPLPHLFAVAYSFIIYLTSMLFFLMILSSIVVRFAIIYKNEIDDIGMSMYVQCIQKVFLLMALYGAKLH